MTRSCKYYLIHALSILLAGCAVGTTTLNRDPTSLDLLGDDAILVMRLQPHYRVHIITGTKSDGGWASDETPFNSAVAVNTFPKDQFIVARVKGTDARQVYGLTAILPQGIGLAAPHFKACAGDVTPTFEVPAGKVVYVGSLLASSAGAIQAGQSESVETVKAKLSEIYPSIAARVEYKPLSFQRLTKAWCAKR
jgi:hypothetical protein